MPREKEGKQKTKGTPLPIVPILRKFLKTYEKHCVQTQTAVCPAIRQDLKTSINNEQILRKVSVWPPLLTPLGSEWTGVLPQGTRVLSHRSVFLPACLSEVQNLLLALGLCSALCLPASTSNLPTPVL